MAEQTKYVLDESRLPEAWYNIMADLPTPPPPPRHPGTGEPIGPGDLAPLFPMALIEQEVSTERFIAIPEEVRAAYRLWRPTPLYAHTGWSAPWTHPLASSTSTRASARPAATSPTPRCRKPTTTRPQAAPGSPPRPAPASGVASLAFACQMFGLECKVYMVRV